MKIKFKFAYEFIKYEAFRELEKNECIFALALNEVLNLIDFNVRFILSIYFL